MALTEGLSNSGWGRTVLAGVDRTDESVKAAEQQVKAFAADAANPTTAEFVVKLAGVQVADPIAS